MQNYLINLEGNYKFLFYFFIFIGILIEGEILLVLLGILAREGSINFLSIFSIVFLMAMAHDFIYWRIGRKLLEDNKDRFLFFKIEKLRPFFEKIMNKNGFYIFFSKFTWSLNRVVLISVGYLKLPFSKIVRFSFPASLLWSTLYLSLGYIFAHQADILKKDLKTALIWITILAILIFLFEETVQKILKKIFGK